MKQIVIGIFAHPDDAGFGPSGTLAMSARDGADVHIICATQGDVSTNGMDDDNLAQTREHEEKVAANVIGASSLKLLRYGDGQLNNNNYLEIAAKIIRHLQQLLPQGKCNITLITFDPNGISGHIDHIVMSHVTTYVYLKLREKHTMKLHYFCVPRTLVAAANTNWLYMPAGREAEEIDEVIDVRSVREQKMNAIKAHKSQAKDAAMHLSRGDALFDEHFIHYSP